jgi:hypothetical protein
MTEVRHMKERVIEQIAVAFGKVEFPGDWCLRDSDEGNESFLLEQEFKGKNDWRILEPKFLDQAPAGYSTALSFFSDEAFHFYLPAYLIADLRDELERIDVAFHLIHGLDNETSGKRINPRRFGDRTWFEDARHKFAVFSRDEAAAIVAYLKLKRESDGFQRQSIDEALRNYWNEQATS